MKRFILGIALALLNVIFVFAQQETSIETVQAPKRVRTIIIDAGHGGRDNGAMGSHTINGKQVTMKEKEISLGIAMALKEKLLSAFPDTKVFLTREDDVTIFLEGRMELASSRGLDTNGTAIYISIHTDWSADKNFRGYRFFADDSHPKNYESFRLAAMISQEFAKEYKKHEIPNRGIINSQFMMSSVPYMPAVILEMGNINNREDAALLCADQELDRCAAALVRGIAAYLLKNCTVYLTPLRYSCIFRSQRAISPEN